MKVFMTYLERNQVFSLSEKGTKEYLENLKSQISSYFKIANNRIIIIQKFDSEWECFIDLDDDTDLYDCDRLRVVLGTDDYCSLTATLPDKVPVAMESVCISRLTVVSREAKEEVPCDSLSTNAREYFTRTNLAITYGPLTFALHYSW